MITLIVHVDVKPRRLYDFIDATKIASEQSLNREKGCYAYTINKDEDNEDGVILIETYENQEAIEHHKKTEHFITWRTDVEDMMNSPRKVKRLESL